MKGSLDASLEAPQKGDLVDLVAPGYIAKPEVVENGVKFLESWGLRARVPKPFFGKDLLSSNSADVRFTHLRKALLARDSQAVWCIRGGYGSLHLIPELSKLKPAPAKLFIGLSDITSLHIFLNQNWGWPTIHGPLLDRLGRKAALPKYEKEMHKLVFGELPQVTFKGLKPMNEAARKERTVRGAVSGGNMVVLQSSLGSNASWETQGRILFFEDTGERGYRIDRMLSQFSQAGLFNHCKAIVFGQFIGGDEADGSNLIQPVLKRFAQSMKIPVLGGLESGHDIIQRPLPFETKAVLKLGARGELTCDTGMA